MGKPVNDVTDSEFLSAVEEMEKALNVQAPRVMEPSDITAPVLAKKWGIGHKAAKAWLEERVAEGKLVCVGEVKGNKGRITTAYRLKHEQKESEPIQENAADPKVQVAWYGKNESSQVKKAIRKAITI